MKFFCEYAISTKMSCAGPYLFCLYVALVLRCLVSGRVKGTGDGLNLERLVLVVVKGDLSGLGVFTDHHVDENFRIVNLMGFFFQVTVLRTGELPFSKFFSFLIIYQSNRDRCKRNFYRS